MGNLIRSYRGANRAIKSNEPNGHPKSPQVTPGHRLHAKRYRMLIGTARPSTTCPPPPHGRPWPRAIDLADGPPAPSNRQGWGQPSHIVSHPRTEQCTLPRLRRSDGSTRTYSSSPQRTISRTRPTLPSPMCSLPLWPAAANGPVPWLSSTICRCKQGC